MKKRPQRGDEVPVGLKGVVIGMRKAEKSYPEIEEDTGVKADTARAIYNRFNNTINFTSAPRSGRPKKLSNRDRLEVKRYIQKDRGTRREPLKDISNKLKLNVHPNTLRTAIQEMGMGHRIARKKPYLSLQQKAARLQFAKDYIHWTWEDWWRVIFTDEMGIQTEANQGRIWIWRYPEEEYDENCCGATHKSGFKKIKLWGAMRYGRLSKLIILSEKQGDGKMNAQDYVDEIMDREFFDFWRDSMEELGDVWIMEDGAGYHQGVAASRRQQYIQDGLQSWGPRVWPANSPDLNPIEHLWHILRTNVNKRTPRPRRKQDLIEALQEEWAKLDLTVIGELIQSMPRRLQAVIDAKGGLTKY